MSSPRPAPARVPAATPARPTLPPLPTLPAHPALRPGTRWARRGGGRWQVDLPPAGVVLDDGPGVAALLEALAGAAVDDAVLTRLDAWPSPAGGPAARAVAALLAAGLVVDGDAVLGSLALRPAVTGSGAVLVRAAAWAAPHADGAAVLRRRAAATVLVTGSSPAAAPVLDLLLAAGCGGRLGPRDRPSRGVRPPDLVVGVAQGEPDRDELGHWLRAGVAHLPVADHGVRARVGPFTVPGATGCVRCWDARAAALDPARPLVASQHGGPPRGLLPPEDPAVRSLLVGWVVRDALAHLDGHRPATWSAVVELEGPGRGGVPVPAVQPVPRHPHCGCAWDLAG